MTESTIDWRGFGTIKGDDAETILGWIAGRPIYAISPASDHHRLVLFAFDGQIPHLVEICGNQSTDPVGELKAAAERHYAEHFVDTDALARWIAASEVRND